MVRKFALCLNFRRMNAELEAKTSELVKEAEQLLVCAA